MGPRARVVAGLVWIAGTGGAGTASAQTSLKGADELQLVMQDVIAACSGATGAFVYIGGGSNAGQTAMTSLGTAQHLAPMSGQLSDTACTPNSRQLMIGLDAAVVVAKNAAHFNADTCIDEIGGGFSPLALTGVPSQFIPCASNTACTSLGTSCDTTHGFCVPGGSLGLCGANQGCATAGTYTFDNGTPADPSDDWKDVLAMLYGGQNHNLSTPQLANDASEKNADGTLICTGNRLCNRNSARIDCASPVRGVLLASYASIIRTPLCTSPNSSNACLTNDDCPLGQSCNTTIGLCTPQECVKLKHAFRRDDLASTTDIFVSLVGLVPIAPYTAVRSTAGGAVAPEVADFAATASPFCNAGTAAMNKGFGDGLDLDPYRRACNVGPAPDRIAFEEVCEYGLTANNSDAGCYTAGGVTVTPASYPQRDRSAPQGRGILAGGSADTQSLLSTEYLAGATKPRCLGVVLPISMPKDLPGATVWTSNLYPAGGNCTPGARGFVNPLPARAILCPDGSQKASGGTCRLPQNTSNGRFDCVTDSTLQPGATPDPRVFNLAPVNNLGSMSALLDAYQNPNFPGVTQLRRFARRYYGLHMVRPDNSKKQATTTGPCLATDDSSQIGCLVKASPCSIGVAGPKAADTVFPFNNTPLRIAGVQASQATIQGLVTSVEPIYPLSRGFWLNSIQDPNVGFAQPNLSSAEVALSACMGLPPTCTSDANCTPSATCDTAGTGRCTSGSNTIIDTAIAAHDFTVLPAGVTRLTVNATGGGCPLP